MWSKKLGETVEDCIYYVGRYIYIEWKTLNKDSDDVESNIGSEREDVLIAENIEIISKERNQATNSNKENGTNSNGKKRLQLKVLMYCQI